MQEKINQIELKAPKLISRILIIGISIAIACLITGLLIFIFKGQPHSALPTLTITEIPKGLLRLDAIAYFSAGIFIMILTPILRVITALVMFIINKETVYILIAGAVLVLVVISYIIARGL